ncbi:L-threonylcarbamoyladenylate synthase [Pseudochryseolinea flava]|uniref:Threonylcarbamoyl-AMP synthase n=1 Tax=Pseudochryseolinea flava TaxID=2059302 RepID=A0A364Y7B8_9BACT|nr:L-threonylcarbamoyladenylate synthase [Pseudochryseolinea flava]RAW01724.1 threonylcarbamoyl-AMP synthase [Pseudochryseolinea flava]
MAMIGSDIDFAKEVLLKGDLVAVPTETVYGLAGNALDPAAAAKIFQVKERPSFDPLIVHVPSFDHVSKYADEIPKQAHLLAEKFWPGPLTILFKKKSFVPDLVTSGLDTVGLRCPDHPLTRRLLEVLPFPLAAPSANPFGYVSPTTAQHVAEQLGEKIPYILDGGACPVGLESTIVGFENERPVIYRFGGLSLEKIESVIGKVDVQAFSTSNPKAPGQLKSHYAPRKKVIIGDIAALRQSYPIDRVALLTFQKNYNTKFQYILSPEGSLEQAAQHLFTALRELDKLPIDCILTEFVADVGLGRAINDRLRRAAAN